LTEFLHLSHSLAVPKTSDTASVYRVQVLDRAIAILDVLAEAREGLSLGDVATAIGVHKSTAHRIIMNLEGQRMVDRDPATGRYRLGLRLFELGSVAIGKFDIRERARQYLETILRETQESVHLCVLDGGEVLYLDKIEPSRTVRLSSRVGLRNPVHCTAVGKAMMAWLPDSEIENIVQRHGLRRFTTKTITTLAELRAELVQVRECGYAVDDEEHEDDVRCVAAVVRDHAGRPAAAMSIAAPSFRIPRAKIPVFAQTICKAAQELSREWGFNPTFRELTVTAVG
jgi:IclR family KDG regulon transcriptional repressor